MIRLSLFNYVIKRFILTLFYIFICYNSESQNIKVLFIGNSYTASNNLPAIINQLALSVGDTLEHSSNTPGGYTFQQHCSNTTTINLIEEAKWDFVVLQEQSQLPSFPDNQVAIMVYPYAAKLDSMIKFYNPCATTTFFMTWGRRDGDPEYCPVFPPVCTYEGMDSLLQLRYTIMAENNHAAIAPVAKVWRKLRTDNPEIELYSHDGSHPSNSGSFAAACTFYSILFGKDPELTSYNFTLDPLEAATIKHTAKAIVYDSLDHWFRFEIRPIADFSSSVTNATVIFTNHSTNADSYFWDFGDGNSSTLVSPVHTYSETGRYEVSLEAIDVSCGKSDIAKQIIEIITTGIFNIKENNVPVFYPNPAGSSLIVKTDTKVRYLTIYDSFGREVICQIAENGCTEIFVDVSTLHNGVYYLVLSGEDYITSRSKFVKYGS